VRHIKLQQPDRARIRVRDLAREVGVPDVDLLAWLRTNGEWTKSALSFLEEPVADRICQHFDPDGSSRAQVHAGEEVPSNSPPSPGLTAPTPRAARVNNPYLGQPRTSHPARARRDAPSRQTLHVSSAQDSVPDYSAAGSPPASEAMAPFEWAVRGVDNEKEDWLAHGLGPRDARLAAACRDAGLAPSDLKLALSGWTVLDRITRGEGPMHVARLLARQQEQDRHNG
jgi:hypothetical protein